MKDARFGKPVVGHFPDPFPYHLVLLAASPKRSPPEIDDMVTEGPERRPIGRHCVVLEETGNNLPEPFRLFAYGLMHAPSQLLLDFREL
jgi:hypothetical protein